MLFRVYQHVVGTCVWPNSFLVFAVLIPLRFTKNPVTRQQFNVLSLANNSKYG